MSLSEEYIVDNPSPDNPLLMKDGEEYTGEKEFDEDEEKEKDRVIWKGENVE